jgi:hypothetical protein
MGQNRTQPGHTISNARALVRADGEEEDGNREIRTRAGRRLHELPELCIGETTRDNEKELADARRKDSVVDNVVERPWNGSRRQAAEGVLGKIDK